jgi:hypothetical protein
MTMPGETNSTKLVALDVVWFTAPETAFVN